MNITPPKNTIPKAVIQSMPPWSMPTTRRDAGGSAAVKIHRMNLNESAYPPSPKAIAAMQEACTRVNYYPDPNWSALVEALSEHTGIAERRIVLGNGSDETIVAAGRIALEPGDEVIAPVPSFPGYYKCAAINGATLVPVRVRDDGANDVDAMLAAVTDKTRLVFLATPNNPTGGMLRAEDVRRLVLGVPDTALLILDEAYYEFGQHAGGDEHLGLMAERTGPWGVFRTFSKAYGLAGIRVGYVLCGSDEIAGAFQTARSVFNVNVVAQAGALAALGDPEHMRGIVAATAAERERISAGLKTLGCKPFPSVGNFVAAWTRLPAADVVSVLAGQGIMISRLMSPGFEHYIRVTVGTADDTDVLLTALRDILAP